MLYCNKCQSPISEKRIKSILDATDGKHLPTECEKCSNPGKPFGLLTYSHKTAGEVVMLSNPSKEQKRQMIRCYNRSR